MPTRPLSHEQRQRQRNPTYRKAADQAYAGQRRVQHGPDPRSTARWRAVRQMVLARQPLCADIYGVHQREGRIEAATEVDHIRPIWEAPHLVFDAANLQPLCRPCHGIKNARERDGLHDVWLICGPPGAGKSTYVRQHMCAGDMVVDFDRFLMALLGRDMQDVRNWNAQTEPFARYVWAAYDAVTALMARRYAQAKAWRGEGDWYQPLTWVLGQFPERQRRQDLALQIGARCLMLAVPAEECLAHIATDPQRQHDVERWRPLIARWWERYEPDASDRVLVVEDV